MISSRLDVMRIRSEEFKKSAGKRTRNGSACFYRAWPSFRKTRPGGVEQFFKTFNPSGVVSSYLFLSPGFYPGLLTFRPFGVVCPEVSGQFTPLVLFFSTNL
jgi:hypothetical protein